MNTRMMGFMGCRIFAIYWLYHASIEVSRMVADVQHYANFPPDVILGYCLAIALVPIYLAVSAVLWYGAGFMSEIIAKGTSRGTAWCRAWPIATGAALATGLLLAAISGWTLIAGFQKPYLTKLQWIDQVIPAFDLVIGLLLVKGARRAFLPNGVSNVD